MRRLGLSVSPVFLFLTTVLTTPAWGQLEPPSTGGVVALDHALRMLGHYKRVLMIGAHPDDEDTELLTILVRGMGAEAAYLSLNRGEGGQNLIGPELGEALGLIRTEELLAARRLDGARQYFTRAYDFGYSKSLEETWAHWPRDTILKDVVRVVRRFRPQIVVSIFSGTPDDGHGQHQAAGWAAQEAFRVAGDSTRFPELLTQEGVRPWTPLKLYRSTRFDSAATTLTLDGGVLDPAVGKSFHQIAMAGRSLHRSQDMGQLQTIGPSTVRLALLKDRTVSGSRRHPEPGHNRHPDPERSEGEGSVGVRADPSVAPLPQDDSGGRVQDDGGKSHDDDPDGLFAGIDTSLAAMPWTEVPGTKGAAKGAVRALFVARVDSVRQARALGDSRQLLALLARTEADLLAPKRDSVARLVLMTSEQAGQLRHLSRARAIAAGLVGDALVEDDRLAPGQRMAVTLLAWNAGADSQTVVASVLPPDGWEVDADTAPVPAVSPIPPDSMLRRTVTVRIPDTTAPTTPYFLRRPLRGAMYDWRRVNPLLLGEPFEPPAPAAIFEGPVFGARLEREVTFRFNDQGRGEVRRPLIVVPRVDVKLEPEVELWSTLAPGAHRLTVTLTHGARDTTTGAVRLEVPQGWPAVEPRSFRFTREDERETFVFDVHPPVEWSGDSVEIRAVAVDYQGRRYRTGVFTVDYPHIRPRAYVKRAAATVRIVPLALPKVTRVGYVRGAADRVPEALMSVGVPIVVLDAEALERGDLSRYDAIVIGPRAYETDAVLGENNGRLLRYVRRGGLMIVQYQQHRFFNEGFAPYPLTVGGQPLVLTENGSGQAGTASSPPAGRPVSHDRVTDERAPVRMLVPDHLSVRSPNRITAADWRGWVQERGLYFARSWDPAYRPILETQDPGEAPLQGGLLVATVGTGTYVYTGLSFFRQLPAGVPGAYRLFANLLALPHGR